MEIKVIKFRSSSRATDPKFILNHLQKLLSVKFIS